MSHPINKVKFPDAFVSVLHILINLSSVFRRIIVIRTICLSDVRIFRRSDADDSSHPWSLFVMWFRSPRRCRVFFFLLQDCWPGRRELMTCISLQLDRRTRCFGRGMLLLALAWLSLPSLVLSDKTQTFHECGPSPRGRVWYNNNYYQ